ncbi:uncharacterized protein [Argopecten irradians]|uniref:uncharacterized protein n=1 Tax=Argopecten irradians TaxID=31199 RepID=UPI003719FDDC
MRPTIRTTVVCVLVGAAICILLTFHRPTLHNFPDIAILAPNAAPIRQPPKATAPPLSVPIPAPEILDTMNREELYRLQHRYMENLQIYCPRKRMYGGVGKGWYACELQRNDDPPHCDAYAIVKEETPESKSFFYELKTDYGCEKHVFLKGFESDAILAPLNYAVNTTTKHNSNREIYFMVIATDGDEERLVKWMMKRNILKHVQQLFVTFHGIDARSNEDELTQHLSILKALYDHGFRTFHYNLNPKRYYHFDQRMWTVQGRYTLYMMRDLPTFPPIVLQPVEDLKQMSLSQLGELYHSYMHTSQEFCRNVVRVGQAGDGGWNMCNTTEYRPVKPCLVYSFGINNDWGFDDAISSEYGCEVHAFDPSMGVNDHKRSEKIYFHNLALSDKNGIINGHWKSKTLQSIIHSLGHDERIIDIVKMDIEGSEWPAMESFIPSGTLKNIRQLYFEFHTGITPSENYRTRMINFRKLYDNGFRLFWGHPNPVQVNLGRYVETGRQVSACYEEYYINVKLKRLM